MRLRTVEPPLPPQLLDALAEIGITTDADLMFAGPPMELFQRLPPGTVALKELERCVRSVVAYVAAPGVRSDVLLREYERARVEGVWGCGVKSVDELVGGFGPGRVVEVSGDRGSVNMETLALQAILRHLASDASSAAYWIDTVGDFSADRIPIVLGGMSTLPAAPTATDRLQISLAFDVEAIHEVLETLRTDLDTQMQLDYEMPPPRVRCLVIDSITPIFRPLLSVVSSQGHAIMTSFMRQLRSFARTYNLSILVLNGTSASAPRNPLSAFPNTVRKPALGPTFTFMTDATLWLAKAESEGKFVAEVLRSRDTPAGKWCSFSIRNGILREEESRNDDS